MACGGVTGRIGRCARKAASSAEFGPYGVDMTAAMRERAMAGANVAGLTNVEVRDGDATHLSLDHATLD